MRIASLSTVTFQKLNMRKSGDMRVPEQFSFKDKSGQIQELGLKERGNKYKFYLKDNENKHIDTFVKFSIEDDAIYGKYIVVEDENKGIGTVLHLARIIEMLENDIPEIKIEALNTAVMFHAKAGFRGDIKTPKEDAYVLSAIIRSAFLDEAFVDISQKAAKLLTTPKRKPEETNKLFTEFLDIAVKLPRETTDRIYFKDDTFDQRFMYGMKLTKDDVIKNKDFYNKLFKKYCIDYEID